MIPKRSHATLAPLILVALSVGIIGTIGEFMLGQLGWAFKAELDVSIALIGTLSAAMFIGGGVASFASGWLVDRVAPKVLLPIQATLATVSFAAFGFARNAFELLVVCIAVGVCMTFNGPLTNRMIALYLPRRQYSVAVGWKSLGAQLSAVLVGLSLGGLAEFIPWRTIIWMWVGVSIVATLWATSYLRRTPLLAVDEVVPKQGVHELTSDERHDPIVWWLLPISFFSIGAFTSLGAYLPSFAMESFGMSVGPAGFGMVVAATTSVFARFIWLRLMRRVHGMKLLAGSGVLAAMGGVVLMISPMVGSWLFWGAIALLGAVALGSFPVVSVLLIQHANINKIGVITAWAGLAGFAGLAAQPLFQSLLIGAGGITLGWLVIIVGGLMTTLTVVAFYVFTAKSHDRVAALI